MSICIKRNTIYYNCVVFVYKCLILRKFSTDLFQQYYKAALHPICQVNKKYYGTYLAHRIVYC